MSGGGGPNDRHRQQPQQQPSSDGEFLLRLLQNRHQPPPPSHNLSLDPAVSSVGPSHTIQPPPWPHHFSPAPPSFRSAPHHHFGNFNLPSSSHATPSSLNNSHLHASSGNFSGNVKDLNFGQGFDLLNKSDLGFGVGVGVGGSVPTGFESNRRIDPNSSSNVQGGYNYKNMKDVNFGQGFDLLKERDLGFGAGGSMPNGFGSDRRIDPNSSSNVQGGYNYNSSNNNNMRDSNLGQGFDMLKERELGFGLGSNMRNGVGSDRRIDPNSSSSHARGGYNYDNMKGSSLGQGFDLLKERDLGYDLGGNMRNETGLDRRIDPRINWANSPPEPRQSGPPPRFSGSNLNQRRNDGDLYNVGREMGGSSEFSREMSSNRRGFSGTNEKSYDKERRFLRKDDAVGVRRGGGGGLSGQLDHPGLPAGTAHHSVLGSDVDQSLKVLHCGEVDNEVSHDEVDELSERLVDSVLEDGLSDEKNELNGVKKHPRDKDFRSDARGKWILPQRTRNSKRMIECRRDIHRLSAPFLAIYKSLIPPEEEKLKQKQLMSLLEKLVSKEWPNAKLYLYGSCANSFGVSKSDIDVCLAIDDQDINKSEILLKLAEILESDNLQNVQALTRARVPIVKLMDPVTGISCDICINNVLAVVNTKLLRDYAEIDGRLRQLAFLVKYWAKSRGVNETYQGTLSSYAYVLMCIHFLQQRNPPILPCLQGMKATYAVVVDQTEYSFFDQVEKLHNFGAQNKENIAQLIWGFFSYWAYCHDYANTVISVRTGNILSKHEKDWTRRVGNDRHLICIEDPFEVTHDLGRVVDKHSIRVLREEFERAAWIMQNDLNPCATLFEPYVPAS